MTKEDFYKTFEKTISSTKRMGDFNAQIGPENTNLEGIIDTQGIGRKTEDGELFIDMCASNNLAFDGTIFAHKRIHKVTWISPDKVTETQIDHITI